MKALIVYRAFENREEVKTIITETKSDDVNEALDELYRRFNRVTGNPIEEDCTRLQIRSMSVGDRIYFPELNQQFECGAVGWIGLSHCA